MMMHMIRVKYTLRTKVLHGPVFCYGLRSFCGTCAGAILILRHRNLSLRCLLRFLYLIIKIFTACSVKLFTDCNTKIDHAEFLSLSQHGKAQKVKAVITGLCVEQNDLYFIQPFSPD